MWANDRLGEEEDAEKVKLEAQLAFAQDQLRALVGNNVQYCAQQEAVHGEKGQKADWPRLSVPLPPVDTEESNRRAAWLAERSASQRQAPMRPGTRQLDASSYGGTQPPATRWALKGVALQPGGDDESRLRSAR
jgi:hypothetical protein